MKKKALGNLKVIDLTHYIAGPYCTKLLAGFGADVIKVEPPETGDKMRETGPFFKNKKGSKTSIPFLWLNTGKKSITLNLKSGKGVEILKELICSADILVENFSPGVMARLGLTYDTLKDINPRLVMTSISNFGQSGPYRDFKADDIQMYALSGGMYLTGKPDRQPLNSGPSICQYTAAQHAYLATLMAVFHRNRTGKGQYVDVSIQECSLENIEINLTSCLHTGNIAKRGPHLFVPWELYECRDGYAEIIAMPHRNWHHAKEMFINSELFDKKYENIRYRVIHRNEFEDALKPCVKTYKKKDIFEKGQEKGLAFGYLAGLDDVVASPQHRERAFFKDIDHPDTGKHKYCNAPFNMSLTPWHAERSPMLGEHNQITYNNILGYSEQDIQFMKEEAII